MKKLKVADFFCGAGGFSEGFRQVGFEIVFALDNWNPARQTHKLNHSECSHPGLDCYEETQGDIMKINVEEVNKIVPDVHVIVGSPPCVSFSSSNRAGKADKSEGVNLIEKFLQIIAIKKHSKNSSLKYWLMENVPNSRKYVKEKYKFTDLGLTNEVLKKLDIEKEESDIALKINTSKDKIYNSVNYRVPQARRRFITGEFPEPKVETPNEDDWITLGMVLDALRERNKEIVDPVYNFKIENEDLTDHFYDTEIPEMFWKDAMIKKTQGRYYGKMSFPEDEDRPSRTVMATRSTRSRESLIVSNGTPETYRALTIREAASLMSFPITYQFQANRETSKYRLVGNAVCPALAAAFGRAILEKEGLSPVHNPNPKTKKDELNRDLREKPPKKKKPKKRHKEANFAEIVPDLKIRNFRVELDNNFPKKEGNELEWKASLHHGTGRNKMKVARPDKRDILNLMKQYEEEEKVKLYIKQVHNFFSGKIPSAEKFQELHCQPQNRSNYLTPRDSLQKTLDLVNKHFPEEKFRNCNIKNKGESKNKHIEFYGGTLPSKEIPLRVLAGTYAVLHLEQLIKSK